MSLCKHLVQINPYASKDNLNDIYPDEYSNWGQSNGNIPPFESLLLHFAKNPGLHHPLYISSRPVGGKSEWKCLSSHLIRLELAGESSTVDTVSVKEGSRLCIVPCGRQGAARLKVPPSSLPPHRKQPCPKFSWRVNRKAVLKPMYSRYSRRLSSLSRLLVREFFLRLSLERE